MEKIARNNRPAPFIALIVAGGKGARLGGEKPKQYQYINGKPLLRHTLKTFLACPGLERLQVIIDPAHDALYQEAVSGLPPLPAPVAGGATRQDSVFQGLMSLSDIAAPDSITLIHDAARPLVTVEDILSVVRAAHPAATLALPVADTLRHTNGLAVDRQDLWAVQTPQGFHYDLIYRAHKNHRSSSHQTATDDASMVTALGEPVQMVTGSRRNFKITTADDMMLAKDLMSTGQTRTGLGFDVHAFTEGTAVRLCGIDIPFKKKLAGHSDADVGLHALTDALLGSVAAGDIGQHFPPSDPQWKNADSARFLEHAVEIVRNQGGRIENVDITIICEAPKIGPHRNAMQSRVASICGITPAQVGIKATTTEGLGFTGRGEGIAAQAVATISMRTHDN